MRYGVAEILRSRAPVTTGSRQHVGDRFGCELANIEPGLPVHHKGKRTKRPLLGLNGDPARKVVGRLYRHLTPNQLAKLRFQVGWRESEQHALALATAIKGHHQARLLFGASEPLNPEAERAVPAPCRALSDLHMLHLRLPD